MCRVGFFPGDFASEGRAGGRDRGDAHSPIFVFLTCCSNAPIARARIFPTSPSGTEWRSRERSSWSSAWTFSSAVKRTEYRCAPSASVLALTLVLVLVLPFVLTLARALTLASLGDG
jgi:hypothetical protein